VDVQRWRFGRGCALEFWGLSLYAMRAYKFFVGTGAGFGCVVPCVCFFKPPSAYVHISCFVCLCFLLLQTTVSPHTHTCIFGSVHIYIYIYIYIYLYIYIYIYICTHASTHASTHGHTRTHILCFACLFFSLLQMASFLHVLPGFFLDDLHRSREPVCVYVYICLCVNIFLSGRSFCHSRESVCVHVRARAHTHTYTQT
jgi:hypothetical protein